MLFWVIQGENSGIDEVVVWNKIYVGGGMHHVNKVLESIKARHHRINDLILQHTGVTKSVNYPKGKKRGRFLDNIRVENGSIDMG